MARASSDLDLRNIDGAKKPKRSRRDRKKPQAPESLKEQEAKALAFAKSLPLNPGVVTEERGETWQVQSPHNDERLWQLQLAQAFGTRSNALMKVFLSQLANLCPNDWDEDRQCWKTNETEWNSLLALVADHQPVNSAQAALAAQMAATHLMMVRVSAQALNGGHIVRHHDASIASKLARTYAMQCETMLTLKGKTRTAKQSIHVTKEEHIHYHDNRGIRENANQSHGRAQASDASEALWSEEQSGQSLPCPGGTRERAVPVSRGKSGCAKR